MKLLPLAILFLSSVLSSAQEYVTLSVTGNGVGGRYQFSEEQIVLGAGDAAQIQSSFSVDSNQTGYVQNCVAVFLGDTFFFPEIVTSSNSKPLSNEGFVIAGPAVIRAYTFGNEYNAGKLSFLTAKITRAGGSPSFTPSGAVVIPENASGQFQVILESSVDMVTWTAANPGTYGGSEAKRFFRTRIVKQ